MTVKSQPAGPYSIGSNHWPGLSKVIEESGEVAQKLGKLIGSGGDEAHFDGSNLRAGLIDELADLRAAIAFFVYANFDYHERQRLAERSAKKFDRFNGWHVDGIAYQVVEPDQPTAPDIVDAFNRLAEAKARSHVDQAPRPGESTLDPLDSADPFNVPVRSHSPYTIAHVIALNAHQRDGRFHPYTCGVCRDRLGTRNPDGTFDDRRLVATLDGWICPTCDYTQPIT